MSAPQHQDIQHQEMLFQYDKLRLEILNNDTLALQSLGATVLLASATMGFAFSQAVTPRLFKSAFFLSAIIISFIGLAQSVDRMRSTFTIASYLRVFVEGNTKHLRWETRLQKFRDIAPGRGHNRFGAYLNTYLAIALVNFGLINAYIIREYQQNPNLYNDQNTYGLIALISLPAIGSIVTGYMVYLAINRYNRYVVNNTKTFDETWRQVYNEQILRERLDQIREKIKEYSDKKSMMPQKLNDLVLESYMQTVPEDPFTGTKDWFEVREGDKGITNVRSRSELKSSEGTNYNEW